MNTKRAVVSTEDDFLAVREYLLSHPRLGKDNPAIEAAIKGVDKELKNIQRDERLRKKFVASSSIESEDGYSKIETAHQNSKEEEAIVSEPSNDNNDMTDDWQEVSEGNHAQMDGKESAKIGLGAELAKASVAALGKNRVTCSTPLGALAAVLHATLVHIGFSCTGIPIEKKPINGFASPPSKFTFLPSGWERTTEDGIIRLRYRKTLAITMQVKIISEKQVEIMMGENSMMIDVVDHFNVDSWALADKPAPPSLHYKALSELLTKFTHRFDLGLEEATSGNGVEGLMLNHQRAVPLHNPFQHPVACHNPLRAERFPSHPVNYPGQRHPFIGDFSGDLTPAGLINTGGINNGNPHPGNLMGPGHPLFAGGDVMGGMKPRFDPFGPPGGPMDPKNGAATGNPNNDLAMPPRFDPNNMFL